VAKNKKSSVQWIVSKSSKILPAVFLLAVLGAILSFVNVKFAVASMNLLDSATGKNSMDFVSCVIRIVLLLVLDLLLQVVYTVYDIRVRTKYKHHLQRQLFKTVTTRSCPDIAGYHSGELINRLTSDINMINSNVVDVIPGTITLLSGIVFSFIEMVRLDLTLSLICLALGPVVLFCAMVYGRRIKPLYKDCQESDGKVRSFMQECIQNIIIVKAFRRERKVQQYADMLRKKNFRLNMKLSYISVLANIIYYVAMTAAYYLAVAWCAYKISVGIMTVGAFTAIVQLVGSIQSPFRNLAGVIPKVYAACASAERIMEIEEKESEAVSNENFAPDDFEAIIAEKLSFSYDNEDVLKDASLEIKRGETVVIHGMSGIGKSTFFKLLLGVIKPQRGKLKVGFKDESVDAGVSTRAVFSYVPQGNMLISGTIKENIALKILSQNRLRGNVKFIIAKKNSNWHGQASIIIVCFS